MEINRTRITRFNGRGSESLDDHLAVESPLEIRVYSGPLHARRRTEIAVTMRTPGHDGELAPGYLFNEGILASERDLLRVDVGPDEVDVHLHPETAFDPARFNRNGVTTSSCGVCGKTTRDLIPDAARPLPETEGLSFSPEVIKALPAALRRGQEFFSHTGGLHAAGLFSERGELILLREDVGRHNALDKLAGRLILDGIDPRGKILLLSGRASFELIQKAVMCRIPLVAAIGAPSSLAVKTARDTNLTLIGFLRADGFNVYAGTARIDGGVPV